MTVKKTKTKSKAKLTKVSGRPLTRADAGALIVSQKKEGKTYAEIANTLKKDGYVSKQSKRPFKEVTVATIARAFKSGTVKKVQTKTKTTTKNKDTTPVKNSVNLQLAKKVMQVPNEYLSGDERCKIASLFM